MTAKTSAIFLWGYFIPAMAIISMGISLHLSPYYVMLVLGIYFCAATFVLLSILDIKKQQEIRQAVAAAAANGDLEASTTGAAVTGVSTPPVKADYPPSYLEASKDPPPYSLLKYYWQKLKIRRSPSIWSLSQLERSNSLESRSPHVHRLEPEPPNKPRHHLRRLASSPA